MTEESKKNSESKKTTTHIASFMLAEYTGIAKAFSDLHGVILKMMNYFLLIAAVPISFVTLLFKATGKEVNIDQLPPLVTMLFLLIAVSGCIFTLILINLRMGQIRYARTVNLIRRFFSDISKQQTDIQPYLILPATDERPPFHEKFRAFFWQVFLIGLIDGAYLCLGLKNTQILSFLKPDWLGWIACAVIAVLFFCFHFSLYKRIGRKREEDFEVKKPLSEEHKGNI